MCYPAWLAALSSNKYKCWYPFRAEWHHLCGAELSLQGRCGSCVCRGLQREGTARQGQGSASLCSGRAPPGNGEGGDSGVDCTAAHCSTPGTKISLGKQGSCCCRVLTTAGGQGPNTVSVAGEFPDTAASPCPGALQLTAQLKD